MPAMPHARREVARSNREGVGCPIAPLCLND
jgi:hypothetical protein